MVKDLILLAIALPLIGSVVSPFTRLAPYVATATVFGSFILSCVLFSSLDESVVVNLFNWITVSETEIEFSFTLDRLSMIMMLLVTGVGGLIHLYSIEYMKGEPVRYFSYLNLFIFSMLVLVLGSNLPMLFIGWEGVGLCSYLLISFWFKNEEFVAAGTKAFIVNRIGDLGILLAMFILLRDVGTLDFKALENLFSAGSPIAQEILFLVAICLFIGVTGKSAQLPLFVWLPDAMAGPTPVSALIHAATMVTAGVYLMARANFIFDVVPEVLVIVLIVASLTAFIGATAALFQKDLKKILAYSTVSQLGFMFIAVASQAYWVAIFHVLTHAFFKAALFLGAGTVIHGCFGEQRISYMGGLLKKLPYTSAVFGVCCLAIAGVFPLSGAYSKHAIFDALENSTLPYFSLITPDRVLLLLSIAAFLTAVYMGRTFERVFLGEYRGKGEPHEGGVFLVVPVLILGIFALASGGYLLSFLPGYLYSVLAPLEVTTAHFSFIPILGLALGILLKKLPEVAFFERAWGFDELYRVFVVKPFIVFSKFCDFVLDRLLLRGTIDATVDSTLVLSEGVRLLHSGKLKIYLFYFFAGVVLGLGVYVVG